jgi:hypothetical protein
VAADEQASKPVDITSRSFTNRFMLISILSQKASA